MQHPFEPFLFLLVQEKVCSDDDTPGDVSLGVHDSYYWKVMCKGSMGEHVCFCERKYLWAVPMD